MKSETTILVSAAAGIALVCLLLTSLNMYMLNTTRTTLKQVERRLPGLDSDEESTGVAALVDGDKREVHDNQNGYGYYEPDERDHLIDALYRQLDFQAQQLSHYEMQLQHLAALHEHRRELLEEQERVRDNHMKTQQALESQRRKLTRKMTKFQLERQAHEHRLELQEYERQLQQTFDKLHELQQQQEEQQRQQQYQTYQDAPSIQDNGDGMFFTVHHPADLPFSPLEHFFNNILGGGFFEPYDEQPMGPALTVSLGDIKDQDNTAPDFADEPTPVDDETARADSIRENHYVVNRVLPDEDSASTTTTTTVAPPTLSNVPAA